MTAKFQNPLRGQPRTRQSSDKHGHPCFFVSINELTARRAKARDDMNDLAGGLLLILGLLVVLGTGLNVIAGAMFGVLALLVYWIFAAIITSLFKKATSVELHADAINLPGLVRARRYARNMEHSFQLLTHDETFEEQLKHDLEIRNAAASGKVLQKTAYFGQSYHVVLVYAGHRVDIAEVYGIKEAGAIIDRLNYCDRVLDQALNMGGGVKPEPRDDWPKGGPGGLGGLGDV